MPEYRRRTDVRLRSAVVTSEGSPTARFRRAYKHGASLAVLTLALRDLPTVGLGDALLYVLAHADEPDGDSAHSPHAGWPS